MRGLLLVCAAAMCASGALALPIRGSKSADFASLFAENDDLARNKFFPMAAAAYADDQKACVSATFNNASVHHIVVVECGTGMNEPADCAGFAGVDHDERAILLVFRGTHGIVQLAYEGYRTLFQQQRPAPIGGTVGAYFHGVYENIMNSGLKESLSLLYREYPDYDFYVTGHSLGGAMAAIAAAELVSIGRIPSERVKLITFGEPRTGNRLYAAAHDSLLTHSYRVVNARDVVAHLPAEGFNNYYHHKSEVWYQHTMVGPKSHYVECDAKDEDDKCSNRNIVNLSIDNHLHYYGKEVTAWGPSGCETTKN